MINNLKTKNKGFDVLVGIGRPRPTGRYAEKNSMKVYWNDRGAEGVEGVWFGRCPLPSGLGGLRERRELPTWSRAEPCSKRLFNTFWVSQNALVEIENEILLLNMITTDAGLVLKITEVSISGEAFDPVLPKYAVKTKTRQEASYRYETQHEWVKYINSRQEPPTDGARGAIVYIRGALKTVKDGHLRQHIE